MDFARVDHAKREDVMKGMDLIWVNGYVFTG